MQKWAVLCVEASFSKTAAQDCACRVVGRSADPLFFPNQEFPAFFWCWVFKMAVPAVNRALPDNQKAQSFVVPAALELDVHYLLLNEWPTRCARGDLQPDCSADRPVTGPRQST
eukprot:1158958-Pelagomonas_calceolata.AAC.12